MVTCLLLGGCEGTCRAPRNGACRFSPSQQRVLRQDGVISARRNRAATRLRPPVVCAKSPGCWPRLAGAGVGLVMTLVRRLDGLRSPRYPPLTRLLDDSRRTGVRPDSVQVIGGQLSMRLPTSSDPARDISPRRPPTPRGIRPPPSHTFNRHPLIELARRSLAPPRAAQTDAAGRARCDLGGQHDRRVRSVVEPAPG